MADDDEVFARMLQAEELERDREFRAAAADAGVADVDNAPEALALVTALSAGMTGERDAAGEEGGGGEEAGAGVEADVPDVDADLEFARKLHEEELAHARALEDAAKWDCPICMDTFDITDAITLSCDHRLCRDCLEGHITSKVGEKAVDEASLTCPQPDCRLPLTPLEVQANVPVDVYDKYLMFVTDVMLERDPNHVRCPRCQLITIFPDKDDEPRVWASATCPNPNCGLKFCAHCKDDVHEPSTCDEYAQWKVENGMADDAFEAMVANNQWRRCPHCRMPCSLDEGCYFMRCRCGKQFCYLCESKLTEADHYSHYPAGPYERECHGRRRK